MISSIFLSFDIISIFLIKNLSFLDEFVKLGFKIVVRKKRKDIKIYFFIIY